MLHIVGDVLKPHGNWMFCIAHVCNDQGLFGRGVAGQIAGLFPRAKEKYLESGHRIGTVSMASIVLAGDVGQRLGAVANMVAQTIGGDHPLDLKALEVCIQEVQRNVPNFVVHAPRIGTGLGRAKWDEIYPLIPDNWVIYTTPGEIHRYPGTSYCTALDVEELEVRQGEKMLAKYSEVLNREYGS